VPEHARHKTESPDPRARQRMRSPVTWLATTS